MYFTNVDKISFQGLVKKYSEWERFKSKSYIEGYGYRSTKHDERCWEYINGRANYFRDCYMENIFSPRSTPSEDTVARLHKDWYEKRNELIIYERTAGIDVLRNLYMTTQYIAGISEHKEDIILVHDHYLDEYIVEQYKIMGIPEILPDTYEFDVMIKATRSAMFSLNVGNCSYSCFKIPKRISETAERYNKNWTPTHRDFDLEKVLMDTDMIEFYVLEANHYEKEMDVHRLSQLIGLPPYEIIGLIEGDHMARATYNTGVQMGNGYANFEDYSQFTVEVLDKSGRWDKAVFSE